MFRLRSNLLPAIIAVSAAICMLGCGASQMTTPLVSATPALTLTPATGAILTGDSIQFNAQVTGASSSSLLWSVNGVTGGSSSTGTISSSGLYTAPSLSTPASFTIKVVSQANANLSASATIAVFATGAVSTTNNPQVAQYSFLTLPNTTVAIEFGPDTNYGFETWAVPAPSGGGAVTILVAGMTASTTYHMRAAVASSGTPEFVDQDHTFATGSLPGDKIPALTATTTPGQTPNSGIELLDLVTLSPSGTRLNVVATDLAGNVIWYYDPGSVATTIPQPVKLLPDGNMLIDYAEPGVDGTDSVLEEIDLAGNLLWQMTAADLNQALAAAGYNLTLIGTHHDVAILPNGHLVVIASENQNFTNLTGYPGTTAVTGDVIIDLDTNRNPVWVWSEFDHLDVNRHPLPFSFPDWTHTNAVIYSPSDGDLIISIRNQDWIMKLDYEDGKGSGAIVWTLGYQGDFTLVGGTDPDDWFYAEHAPYLATSASSGVFELGMFDNGNNRPISGIPCGAEAYSPCFSTVPIFQLDETAKTATLMWRDKLSVFSFFGGYAQTLANGNVEFDECAATLTPTSADVYEVTQTASPQVVWHMQISNQYAYRAFRMPSLYPGVQW